MKLLRNNHGFTLTEMLIVIALIALVGTFVTGQVIGKYNRAKVDATKIQMKNLGVVLDDYRRDCNKYPTTEQGLDALINKASGGPECKNFDPDGYLKNKKIPKDGFGYEYAYESDGNKYVLKSLGADNKEGGADTDKDISSDDLE